MATMDKQEKQTLLIALGGNALVRKGQVGTIEEQFENLKVPIRQIARLSRQYKIIITHGNGPQVGNLLLQQESCTEVPRLPLEIDRIQFGHGTHGVGRLDQTALDHLD
jgi:carbamate kinase